MSRKNTPEDQALRYVVHTRLAEKKYRELMELHSRTTGLNFSAFLREILHDRPVKVFTYDRSLDMVMQELVKLRTEIKAIGININQITRYFNTYPEDFKKQFYAKTAFNDYLAINEQVEQLLAIVTELSKTWLSK